MGTGRCSSALFEAGGPYTMIIKGGAQPDRPEGNVLVARSGWPRPVEYAATARGAANAQQEIADGELPEHPALQHADAASWEPVADVACSWTPCTPETAAGLLGGRLLSSAASCTRSLACHRLIHSALGLNR